MITIDAVPGKTRTYIIHNNKEKICPLYLICTPVTNKFNEIKNYVEDCSRVLGPKFDGWLKDMLHDYRKKCHKHYTCIVHECENYHICNNVGYDFAVIRKNLDQIIEFSDEYIDKIAPKFERYVDHSKRSKSSIFFEVKDIESILRVSSYLKLYSLFYQDKYMKPLHIFHKEAYNYLVSKIKNDDILYKIFEIITSKIYKYKKSDSYMWDYIKIVCCKTHDVQIMHIFNWIINNILVTCDIQQNPISYISSVINTSIQWILKNIYKVNSIYMDTINTEDANYYKPFNNLETYAYNDTITRLLTLAYECLDKEKICDTDFKSYVENKKSISIISKHIAFPMLSKILDIPYKHLMTIPSNHAYLLNVLLYHYLPNEFKQKYPTLTTMLLLYNTEKEMIKTTYIIKNYNFFNDIFTSFMGTKNSAYALKLYSMITGKLFRNKYKHFKTGQQYKIPLSSLEDDIMIYYNDFFSGNLDELFEMIDSCICDNF